MYLRLLLSFLLLISVLPIGHSYAFETKGQACSQCHTLSKEEAKDLLKNTIPNAVILNIQLSPAKGFWEVYLESMGRKGLVYVDFPKKHFFSGALISIAERKNLTQERLTDLNRVDVSQIPLKDALVMGDQNARIRVILFTDPDCPYCAKLHQELKKIVEERKEIAFFIKMFPLVKIHPGAYEKAKAIACEKSLTLLEDAYGGKPLSKPNCETTVVDENIKLAEKLGISSLPALVPPDGRVISGYKDAKTLITLIDK